MVKGQASPKKYRERHNCCVPQCSAVKNLGNQLHQVPADVEQRKLWQIAIKTGKLLGSRMQVCSRHFKDEDYIITSKYPIQYLSYRVVF